jgi:hypothetical protein
MYVFALIVSAILVFGFSNANSEFILKGFAYSALIAGSISIPTKRGVFQFGKYLLLVGMGILFTVLIPKTEEFQKLDIQSQKILNIMTVVFWIVFILASIVSAILAVYAYRNIREVLSRRMLYRNSHVGIFEYSWLYTLDRFCNITVSIVVCTFWWTGLLFWIFDWL